MKIDRIRPVPKPKIPPRLDPSSTRRIDGPNRVLRGQRSNGQLLRPAAKVRIRQPLLNLSRVARKRDLELGQSYHRRRRRAVLGGLTPV